MGIVGVNSIIGRAVKCLDPDKTTSGESGWLGYTPCDWYLPARFVFSSSDPFLKSRDIYVYWVPVIYPMPFICTWNCWHLSLTQQRRTKVGGSKRIRYPRSPIRYCKRWALWCIFYSIYSDFYVDEFGVLWNSLNPWLLTLYGWALRDHIHRSNIAPYNILLH